MNFKQIIEYERKNCDHKFEYPYVYTSFKEAYKNESLIFEDINHEINHLTKEIPKLRDEKCKDLYRKRLVTLKNILIMYNVNMDIEI